MTEASDLPVYEIPGFHLGEELGRGGTSRVFRGRQDTLDREVAIKIITTLGEKGRQRALRLFREARLAGALDHPGIVRAIDAGEGDGFCWFAMDLIAGGSLEDHLEQVGRMSLDQVRALGLKVADALHHAHQRGVVHRDIKPSNILLDEGGEPRLSDLGLAKRPHDPRLTQEGGTLGTPQYMSPEQARTPGNVDARSDLFSLAATLYRALCGVPAFPGSNVAQVITQLLYSEPIAPSNHFAALPAYVDSFFIRGLAKDVDERFQTAREFAQHLQATGDRPRTKPSGVKKGAHPPQREVRLSSESRGKRPQRTLIVVSALVVLGFAGLVIIPLIMGRLLLPPSGPDGPDGHYQAMVAEHQKTFDLISDAEDGRNTYAPMVLARRIDEVERLLASLPKEARAAVSHGLPNLILKWKKAATAALSGLEEQALDLLAKSQDGDQALEIMVSRWGAEKLSVPWRPDSRPDLQAWLEDLEQERTAVVREAIEKARGQAADRIAGKLDVWKIRHREELLTHAAALESLNEILRSTPGYKLLTKEDRGKLQGEIASTAAGFASAPSRWWIAQKKRIVADLQAQDWNSARDKWEEASAKLSTALPDAASDLGLLKARIEKSLNEQRSEVFGLLSQAMRKEEFALAQTERRNRVAQINQGIESVQSLRGQGDLGQLIDQAQDYARTMHRAANMRQTLEEALIAAQNSGATLPSFRPYLRAKVRISPRQILSIKDAVIIAQSGRGAERRYPIQDLTALSIAELLRALGAEIYPSALALVAHWDGDDFLVPSLLGPPSKLAEDYSAQRIRQHAQDALQRLAQRLDHSADRIAIGEWWEIQRDLANGDWKTAIKGLQGLKESLAKSGKYRVRGFWKRFGDQITALDRELRATADLREVWQDHHPYVTMSSTGEVKLELPLGISAGAIPNALTYPPAWRLVEGGLKAPLNEEALTTRPNDLPALKLSLPSLGDSAGKLEVRFQVPEGGLPLGMLGLELHRFSFMMVARLADSASFAPLPLHGLERELWSFVPFRRVGAWSGPLQDYARQMDPWGSTSWSVRPGNHILKIEWDSPVKEITLTLGNSELILPVRNPEVLSGAGFTLRCWPQILIQDLRVVLQGSDDTGR